MPIWEYRLNAPNRAPAFRSIDDFALSFALARTILGYNSSSPQRMRFAAVMQSALDLMIDTSSPRLELIPDYQRVFRDFSGTSRVGELGQALAYHHFLTELGFSNIVDFVSWVENNHDVVLTGQPTPDFLLLNAAIAARPVGLVEAKGTVNPKSCTNRINSGKLQTLCGQTILEQLSSPILVSRLFACISCFHISGGGGPVSTLRIEDPQKRQPPTEPETYAHLLRASYASFFAAIGRSEEAKLLNKGNPIQIPEAWEAGPLYLKQFVPIPVGDENPLTGPDSRKRDVKWSRANFYLQKDVLSFLVGRITFDKINWKNCRSFRGVHTRPGLSQYNDGTAFSTVR